MGGLYNSWEEFHNFLLSFPYGTADEVVGLCQYPRDGALGSLRRIVVLKSRTLQNGAFFPVMLYSTDSPFADWCVADAFDLAGLTPTRFTQLHAPIDVVVASYPAGSVLYDSKEI